MWQHFPTMRLNISDMRAGVVTHQKNTTLPIMDSRFESFHLLNIEFRVDNLVSFKQFMMINSSQSHHTQHRFTWMKILLHVRHIFSSGLGYSLLCFILMYADKNCCGVFLMRDNARPYIANITNKRSHSSYLHGRQRGRVDLWSESRKSELHVFGYSQNRSSFLNILKPESLF